MTMINENVHKEYQIVTKYKFPKSKRSKHCEVDGSTQKASNESADHTRRLIVGMKVHDL